MLRALCDSQSAGERNCVQSMHRAPLLQKVHSLAPSNFEECCHAQGTRPVPPLQKVQWWVPSKGALRELCDLHPAGLEHSHVQSMCRVPLLHHSPAPSSFEERCRAQDMRHSPAPTSFEPLGRCCVQGMHRVPLPQKAHSPAPSSFEPLGHCCVQGMCLVLQLQKTHSLAPSSLEPLERCCGLGMHRASLFRPPSSFEERRRVLSMRRVALLQTVRLPSRGASQTQWAAGLAKRDMLPIASLAARDRATALCACSAPHPAE